LKSFKQGWRTTSEDELAARECRVVGNGPFRELG
jgi:hypothetical protein